MRGGGGRLRRERFGVARRVRAEGQPRGELRAALIADCEQAITGRQWAATHIYGPRLHALRAGEPLVLPGWALRAAAERWGITVETRRGAWAYYRVEPDGRVVEVVARREPTDPTSITGWDEA